MRKLLVVVLFLTSVAIAKSQNITVEGSAPDLYVAHTVAAKENFYSIGRLYNQAPKAIAAYNNIAMEKGLTIGQRIKIPLTAQNLDGSDDTKSGSIPLTHLVAKSETLFKIAQDNNVTAAQIRKWNHLTSDHIAPGTPLVIGHLKMNNGQVSASAASSSPANNNAATPAKSGEASEIKQPASETQKEDTSVSADQASEQVKNEKPAKANSPDESAQNAGVPEKTSSDANTSPAKKDTALAVIPEEAKQPVASPGATVKDEPLKQETSVAKTDESKRSEQATSESVNGTEGVFANVFDQSASKKSLNTKSGEAATFKSTSGWQDKKYYVLISNVAPGTILKISSPDKKAVYAKVLGSMPEMKENDGLLLRLSNAAASYLGIADPKFPVQVSYYQ